MKLFPEDPVFEIGKVGFDGLDTQGRKLDLLGRKPLGQKLTDLVDEINQPLVIALDGGWGSGKSHFLKLWAGAHRLELDGKAEVMYFDAFEHDFLDDPLVSLVGRLVVQGEEKSWSDATLTKMKKAAFPLARGLLRTGVALATAGISEVAGPVVDALAGKIGEATEDQIDGFWQQETGRIAAMTQFKKSLEALTLPKADGDNPQKIVFIVDELDRCRPDYALSLLEIIKHFFAVPNVHFVLGVNLEALENSVRSRYGSQIDAAKYLQKFVQLTINLPAALLTNPNVSTQMAYFQAIAPQFIQSADLASACRDRLMVLMSNQIISLRDIQRILTCFALVPNRWDGFSYGYKVMIVGAAFLKVLHPSIYHDLRAQRGDLNAIADCLSLLRPQSEADTRMANRDWCIWAFALEGQAAWEHYKIPPSLTTGPSKAFSSWGDAFDWRDAREIFADMFDSFSLPAP